MSNFGERLRQERIRLDMSQEAFGAAGGVKKVAQSNYETGKRYPDGQYLERVSGIGVDIQFVVTGIRSDNSEGESTRPSARLVSDGSPVSASTQPGPGFNEVKLYDIEAAAGDGRSLEQEEVESTLYFPTEQLAAQGLDPAQVVGIKVRGDSMDGTLADGDWVLVDRSSRDPRPEGVFLLLVGGERRIKRVQRVAGGAWLLISDNPRYEKELIKPQDMQDVEILGRCEIRIGKIY